MVSAARSFRIDREGARWEKVAPVPERIIVGTEEQLDGGKLKCPRCNTILIRDQTTQPSPLSLRDSVGDPEAPGDPPVGWIATQCPSDHCGEWVRIEFPKPRDRPVRRRDQSSD